MDFHISRKVRDRYKFEDSLFSYKGNAIFANFHSARLFAHRINQMKGPDSSGFVVRAGQINAMGLIDEIFHVVVAQYRTQKAPSLYGMLWSELETSFGNKQLNEMLQEFSAEFPPLSVYQKKQSVIDYLVGETDGVPNRAVVLEELVMLWLSNSNPAFHPYNELFDDSGLKEKSIYLKVIGAIIAFFEQQPFFGPDNQNLIDMLRSPAIAVPNSLKGQLDYIRDRWGEMLGHYLLKLLGSLNMISEEDHIRGTGPGPVRIPVYASEGEIDKENFSPDADWMPSLVVIAKNTYVWLDQLSKKYQRAITQLDQVPEEELNRMAKWGFSGLWLIGLWERSRASARIKQACGNPEAIASAYSLKEYSIAQDLGGEEALQDLRQRAWKHGIRLASDMVPNHMAIDSTWVFEHPDWFISLPYSPFPSYSFSSANLSENERAAIQIEDHYYDRTDAAVVFKYHNHADGQTRFIYHGNDGTSMPWNDTAQLDYLKKEVREAVIQTILDVARRFPIIRFDAAMTLAKRHYQRLWYPLPGGGCDIPSRSEFGMSQAQFDELMPEEFWREVVDRVAREAPDTLLLAEAFWLMEGYFVRTLGMHRVYNSAFMNLLRDEDNAKYRQVMKNTLEFDPEILKRFVNFMNNPDEHTAANQFGKGDKYFGICTLMATMPGLPMFGHGQIEGFSEKYGMEYRRAYHDEQPDQQLIGRHEWQISPLLRKRHLFSGVDQFYLYDFYTPEGQVDENVFTYSNFINGERSLVIYHNRFCNTSGWVRTSTTFMDKSCEKMRQVDLASGLSLPSGMNQYVILTDQLTGLEYIRSCAEISKNGFFIQLDAYRTHVFMDFRIEMDTVDRQWKNLHDHLNGRGTADIQALLWELPMRPILQPLREIVNSGYLGYLLSQRLKGMPANDSDTLLNEAEHKLSNLINGASEKIGKPLKTGLSCELFREKLSTIFHMVQPVNLPPIHKDQDFVHEFLTWLKENCTSDQWIVLVIYTFLDCLHASMQIDQESFFQQLTEWRLFAVIEAALAEMGMLINDPGNMVRAVTFLLHIKGWLEANTGRENGQMMRGLLNDNFVRDYFHVNNFEEKTWFGKEDANNAFYLLALEAVTDILAQKDLSAKQIDGRIGKIAAHISAFLDAAQQSGFILEHFLRLLDQA